MGVDEAGNCQPSFQIDHFGILSYVGLYFFVTSYGCYSISANGQRLYLWFLLINSDNLAVD